jgi:hypothetical protein
MRAALAPPLIALRRLLSQLCGLMLLSGGRRAETRDGIAVTLVTVNLELAAVQDRLREADAGRWRFAREIAHAIWAMSQPPRLSFVSLATDPADVVRIAGVGDLPCGGRGLAAIGRSPEYSAGFRGWPLRFR